MVVPVEAVAAQSEDAKQPPLVTVARLDDPAFYASQPFHVYARLRREAPVFWYEPSEMWAISRYEDVRFVTSHPELFSSAYGLSPANSIPFDDGAQVVEDRLPRRAELRGCAQRQIVAPGTELLPASDPPRHTLLRRLVSSAFTPRVVASLEGLVYELTREALDSIEPGAITEVVEALAAPIPALVIAEMLGVPREGWDDFKRWSDGILAGLDTLGDPTNELSMDRYQHMMEFGQYFAAALLDRETNPRDDLLSALVQAEADGERLDLLNQLSMVGLLLVAGNETTRSLISTSVELLAAHPDQRAVLSEHPELMASAVEELLRMASPLVTFCRTAVEDTKLRGQKIRRGDYLVLLYAAANRDEEIWQSPEELDVTRPVDFGHMAFGFGPHHCLGASLARLEARVVLTELLQRYPDFALAGSVERTPHASTPGICRLPVVFHPSSELRVR